MVTKKPTKAEFVEALREKGINNLEDLVDAIMPETGGYSSFEEPWLESADHSHWTIKLGRFSLDWGGYDPASPL